MSNNGTIGTIRRFQRKGYEAFYWKIEGFSTLSENKDDYYFSEDFFFKVNRNFLKFYPNRESCESRYLAVFFYLTGGGLHGHAHLTLGLKTRSGRIEKVFSLNVVISEDKTYGAPYTILRSEFLKKAEELAPSDCLTFVAFFSSDTLEILRDVADQTETGYAEKNDKEKPKKKGSEKVVGDMAKLLTSGDMSDALIFVKEVEFKVHSCILAARTPALAALFEHDTMEKATRRIRINNCEPSVFKEFLNHIYTGSVQNLTAENAFGLYRVADKYLLKDLKEVSRKCIADSLSSETFCDALQLALRYADDDLLESVIDYFAANTRIIVRSVQWQRYIEENPKEANDILIKLFGPL